MVGLFFKALNHEANFRDFLAFFHVFLGALNIYINFIFEYIFFPIFSAGIDLYSYLSNRKKTGDLFERKKLLSLSKTF